MPSLHLRNQQRQVALDGAWLRRVAAFALEECAALPEARGAAWRALEEISVAIVSDRRIAQMHVDFMGILGPTDVLTFDSGDIAISAETARRYAAEYGEPVDREVARYIVHGLLHLLGYDDLTARERRRMHAVQERILRACLRRIAAD